MPRLDELDFSTVKPKLKELDFSIREDVVRPTASAEMLEAARRVMARPARTEAERFTAVIRRPQPEVPESRFGALQAIPEKTFAQKVKGFFVAEPKYQRWTKSRRLDYLHRAMNLPMTVLTKFASGRTFGADKLAWYVVSKIRPDLADRPLEEQMAALSPYEKSGLESMAGEVAEFIGQIQSVGKVLKGVGLKAPAGKGFISKIAQKAPAWMGSGAIDALVEGIVQEKGGKEIAREVAKESLIRGGEAIVWSGVEVGAGKLFQWSLKKFPRFASGWQKWAKGKSPEVQRTARQEVDEALRIYKETGDRTAWDAARIKYAGITPEGVEKIRTRAAPPEVKEFGKFPIVKAKPKAPARVAKPPVVRPKAAKPPAVAPKVEIARPEKAVKPAAAVAAKKQPWGMTKEQIAAQPKPIGFSKYDWQQQRQDRINNHIYIVRDAVKQGKPVPLEVLEEYKGEKWADEAMAKLAKPVPKPTLREPSMIKPEEKPPVKAEPEVVVKKPADIPEAPKAPVTEQEPTVELKGKEAQVFNEAVRTQEKITAAEEGEVGIEPTGASFTDHLETFHSYQLPKASKIPGISHEMKVINGRRLAGKLTPAQANKMIYDLRKKLLQTAIKEKIALRVSKKGKVRIGLRKSGVFVPEEFAEYTKFKDIKPILGGGQDIKRAIQQMDGSLTLKEKRSMKGQAGVLERFVKWRTNKMWIQKLKWLDEKTIEAEDILSDVKHIKQREQVTLILAQIGKADRNIPIENVLSKETLASTSKEVIKAAQELRQLYDDMHWEQNTARAMLSRDLIPYLENYSPHILADTTIWSETLMRDKTAKDLEKMDLPDYIRPNAAFNPRAMAREAGIPYDKRILDAKELVQSYIRTAANDIYNTSIIQNNKAFIEQLRSQGYGKSADYLSEWNSVAYAGIKPALERAAKLPKWAEKSMKYFNAVRDIAVFPLNVAWSLGTQVKSIARTFGKYGTPNTVRGFYRWMQPSIRRRAAQDYYSYIIKSRKRGRVTSQDASDLLDANIRLKRNVGEVVKDASTIFITELEKILTGTSIEAAYLHGKARGLTGEALKEYASDGGAKTQEMYNLEDKPMMLNSLHAKTFTPYQTFAIGFANNLREIVGKTGTPPDTKLYAVWSLIRYMAALTAINMITNRIRGKEWSWWDMAPLPFRELWLSPIVAAITKKWLPSSSGLASPVGTAVRIGKGINDVVETGNWRKLRNETIKYGAGIFRIPGGVQWARMVDAIIVYSSGGLRDRRGRLLFKMDTPEDLVRGMFGGVWTTKGGREYLEKRTGKKK